MSCVEQCLERCGRECFFFFFFSSRRRHTRCSRDWSSDVCSSDLAQRLLNEAEGLLVDDANARFEALIALIAVLSNRDYAGTQAAARRALEVAADIGEAAALRAQLWIWASRTVSDPSFQLEQVRSQIESAVETFRAAENIDGMLDALEVLSIADLNAAHWKDAALWVRVGLDVAADHGREGRRGRFAGWLSNALVWGDSDARESLRITQELLGTETRRSSRASM